MSASNMAEGFADADIAFATALVVLESSMGCDGAFH